MLWDVHKKKWKIREILRNSYNTAFEDNFSVVHCWVCSIWCAGYNNWLFFSYSEWCFKLQQCHVIKTLHFGSVYERYKTILQYIVIVNHNVKEMPYTHKSYLLHDNLVWPVLSHCKTNSPNNISIIWIQCKFMDTPTDTYTRSKSKSHFHSFKS